jgi:hypothetical protein
MARTHSLDRAQMMGHSARVIGTSNDALASCG